MLAAAVVTTAYVVATAAAAVTAASVMAMDATTSAPSTVSPFPFSLYGLRQISEINESPVLLLLDPKINPTGKELPVSLHESGMRGHGTSP